MLHKEFWGLLFLAFVVWIFVAGDGAARIERGCRPIQWAGNVMVSVTALAVPSQQAGVKRWVDKSEYACRYTAWRLFYQDEYLRYLEQTHQQATGEPVVPSVPAGSEAAATTVEMSR